VHVLLTVLFGLCTTALLIAITGNSSEQFIIRIAVALSILSSLFVSFTIVEKKKKMKKTSFVLIALSSGLLALLGGSLFGMLPAAYLSTK
jgi:hypothetical protein